jgi:hypothetical protein
MEPLVAGPEGEDMPREVGIGRSDTDSDSAYRKALGED